MISLWLRIRPYLSAFVRYMRISYLETKSNYEDTYLGLAWLPISTVVFAGVLSLIFRQSATMSVNEFFLYVLVGYVTWNFISDSIDGSTDIIQKKLDFAIHNNLTLLGLFQKTLIDRLFEYGINLVVLVVVLIVLDFSNVGPHFLLIIPFLVILCLTSLALSYVVNLVTVIYPDAGRLISTGVRFLFFASPVFWVAQEKSGLRTDLVRYNPASYYLSMSREVFGVEPLQLEIWLIGCSVSVVICLLGAIAYTRSHGFVRNIK